jgi:hypothetical protein
MPRQGIIITSDTLTPRLRAAWPRVQRALTAATEYHADRAEAYAKQNAPWQDRTTAARLGLQAQAFHDPSRHVIVLYHQVPYGIWLEVRWAGRYAIILPTIEHEGRELMVTLAGLLRRL